MIWLLVILLAVDVAILSAMVWLALTVIHLRERLLINAREREHWDALFGDHLNAAKTSYEEIRSTVLHIDSYLYALRQRLGVAVPVPLPPHRSKVQ